MSFFCNLPFTEVISNGTNIRPCCVMRKNVEVNIDNYFNDAEMITIKRQLLDGQAPRQCFACVSSERTDGHSPRIMAEQFYPELSRHIKEKNDATYYNIKSVSIRTSNICNLKCLPCEGQSFVRDTELRKLNLIPISPTLRHHPNWDNLLKLDFERLTLLGGEPFYDKITFDLLKNLVSNGKSKSVQIDLNTNLTAITQEKMQFLVENFKKVMIKGSIDGIGAVNDYLRYPSKWADIELCISIVRSFPEVDLVVTTALSNLSLIKYHELIRWAADTKINLFITPVDTPEVLRKSLLPPALKSDLLKIYQSLKIELAGKLWDRTEVCIDTCINICSGDSDIKDWPEFLEWINKHDKLRGTCLNDVFPELLDYTS